MGTNEVIKDLESLSNHPVLGYEETILIYKAIGIIRALEKSVDDQSQIIESYMKAPVKEAA